MSSKTVEHECAAPPLPFPSLPLSLVQNDYGGTGTPVPNLSYRESFAKIIDEALAIMDSIEQEFDRQIAQGTLDESRLSSLPSSPALHDSHDDDSTSMTGTNLSPDGVTKKQ